MTDIQYSAAAASVHKIESFLCLRAGPAEVLQEEVVQYQKSTVQQKKTTVLIVKILDQVSPKLSQKMFQ